MTLLGDNIIEQLLERANQHDKDLEEIRDVIGGEENKVDMTPWLHRTGWPKYFAGQDTKVLVEGTRLDKTNQFVVRVWDLVVSLLSQKCLDSVKDCYNRDWTVILQWLDSTKTSAESSTSFSRDYSKGTRSKYAKQWAALIVLCARSISEPNVYRVPLLDKQRNLVEMLHELWQRESDSGDSVDPDSIDSDCTDSDCTDSDSNDDSNSNFDDDSHSQGSECSQRRRLRSTKLTKLE